MAGRQHHPFPITQWSLIARTQESGDGRREALSQLLKRYLPALHSYLTTVLRFSPDNADDLLQAFITDSVLQKKLLDRADQRRGRFRMLLLTSLRNFAISAFRSRETREARLDELGDVEAQAVHVDALWARTLVHAAISNMKVECEQSGRHDIWGVFEARVLADIFGQKQKSYQDLAHEFGVSSPESGANLLVTAKRMYLRHLRQVIAEYEPTLEDIDDEIRQLRQALSQCKVSETG